MGKTRAISGTEQHPLPQLDGKKTKHLDMQASLKKTIDIAET